MNLSYNPYLEISVKNKKKSQLKKVIEKSNFKIYLNLEICFLS